MHYYLFTVEYDGTDFCGWAKQNNLPTIQGKIELAISKVALNSKFRTLGASKTDAGVHAMEQKVWVELSFQPNVEGFLKALNKSLPPSIQIKTIEPSKEDFRVRNCHEKTYIYQINLGKNNVFENRFYSIPKRTLDIDKLKDALTIFVGEHDFFNFSGLKINEKEKIKTVRSIKTINSVLDGDILKITFKGKGFIRYQIRMILGAAIAYSTNKITLEKIRNVLDLKESKMPFIAEPKGLILKKVTY